MSADVSEKAGRKPRGKPFQKGQSGNPGGRPRTAEPLREAARALTPKMLAYLEQQIDQQDEYCFEACKLLLSYGWGRPPAAPEDHQAMAQSGSGLAVLATDEIVKAVKKLNAGQEEGE